MKVECTGCGRDCSQAYGTHQGYPYHFGCIPARQKPKARMRHCFYCGDEMGVIEDKFYESHDTCGKRECDRAAQDHQGMDREEAHRRLDEDMGW